MDNVFYATMEFVPGVTLREHLKLPVNKWERWVRATQYIGALQATTTDETVHGDPHASNVIICSPKSANFQAGETPSAALKLLDFGTSHFAEAGFSRSRHWGIVQKTFESMVGNFESYEWARRQSQGNDISSHPDYLRLPYLIDVLDGLKLEAGYPRPK